MLGFLNLNKPPGVTSFSLVRQLRRLTGEKRIGFAGTLDPFAEGVLLCAIGRAYTRQLDLFLNLPKTYRVTWVLGIETNTLDPEGCITQEKPYTGNHEKIHSILATQMGDILQQPPAFSAKKIKGKPAYLLARKGIEPELKKSAVTIYDLQILNIIPGEFPEIEMRVHCSKGTYVRSLVRDLAYALDSVGHAKTLVREAVGNYHLDTAINAATLTPESLSAGLFHEVMM